MQLRTCVTVLPRNNHNIAIYITILRNTARLDQLIFYKNIFTFICVSYICMFVEPFGHPSVFSTSRYANYLHNK
jgi:hypothetical protein